MIVIDASAIMAIILRERGWELALERLDQGIMSTVNFCEVLTRVEDKGGNPDNVAALITRAPIRLIDFSSEQALLAMRLRSGTRHAGLSLGDRACLALASSLGLPVLTADQAWAKVDVGVEMIMIR